MNAEEREYIKSKVDQLKLPFGLLSTLFIFSCGGYGFIVSKQGFYNDSYLLILFFVNLLFSAFLIAGVRKIYNEIGKFVEKLKN